MLISSSTVKGKCPVCGAASCACGGPSRIVESASEGSGPLKQYPLGRGRFVQLTDDAARARGLLPPEGKKREQALNKKRVSAPNKEGR